MIRGAFGVCVEKGDLESWILDANCISVTSSRRDGNKSLSDGVDLGTTPRSTNNIVEWIYI